MKRDLRIVYMGTPEFAVAPLRAIVEAGYSVMAIITAPDKPAGRGQKLQMSPVKEFGLSKNIKVLQPVKLKDPEFLAEVKGLNPNLMVVVAFRMLPEIVWQIPEYGTLNLHASLLPQYRGAAPINHAIINGETETGLTTFFIEQEIDTGNIILSRKLPIMPADDAGSLHDRMMVAGADLMLETLKIIETGNIKPLSQEQLVPGNMLLHQAPKIFRNDCKINWNNSGSSIHNLVRGLSPLPAAFSSLLINENAPKLVKIFRTHVQPSESRLTPGTVVTDFKTAFSVQTADGMIQIEELQVEGKKRMTATEYLRGVQPGSSFRFVD